MIAQLPEYMKKGRRVPGDEKFSSPTAFKQTNFLSYLFIFIYKYLGEGPNLYIINNGEWERRYLLIHYVMTLRNETFHNGYVDVTLLISLERLAACRICCAQKS